MLSFICPCCDSKRTISEKCFSSDNELGNYSKNFLYFCNKCNKNFMVNVDIKYTINTFLISELDEKNVEDNEKNVEDNENINNKKGIEENDLDENKYPKLKEWALANGDDLLKQRINLKFNWINLAKDQYLEKTAKEYSLKRIKSENIIKIEKCKSPSLDILNFYKELNKFFDSIEIIECTFYFFNRYNVTYFRIMIPMPDNNIEELIVDSETINNKNKLNENKYPRILIN